MDENDIKIIEQYLNEYTVDRDKVFAQILNLTIMNQGMLEAIMDTQAIIMNAINEGVDKEKFRSYIRDKAATYIAQIQASLASKEFPAEE